MSEDPVHKFDEPVEGLTYRSLLSEIYGPYVRLIRTLEEILGKEKTHEIIAKHHMQSSIESAQNRVDGLGGPFESMDAFRAHFQDRRKNVFSQKSQTVEEKESSPTVWHFCVKECLWATVFRELGAGDLGLILDCNTDFPTAEVFSPHLRLERDKTLMQGDDCCDFIYHWDD